MTECPECGAQMAYSRFQEFGGCPECLTPLDDLFWIASRGDLA